MRKDQIKLSQVRNIPDVIFAPTFDEHMLRGHPNGQTHSGLHLPTLMTKRNGAALRNEDIVVSTNPIEIKVDGRNAEMVIIDVHPTALTFKASVNIYGTSKVSTFFPVGTSIEQAKNHIRTAWNDHCTYGSSSYGGGDVDIYSQMRSAFRMNWVGMATINNLQVWVGSSLTGSVVTAFPAVNNKFGQ